MESALLPKTISQDRRARLFAWTGRALPWLVVALGLAARLRQYLGNPSFWYDEAFLTVSVYDFSWLKLIGPLPGRTIIPPFFLWLLRGCYLAFGPDELAMRLPAFIAGLAGLLLLIPLSRRWLGSPGWLGPVAFCAVSSHCISHTVEVRPYTVDFLLTVTILLLAHAYLNAAPQAHRGWGGGLLTAAALAPWLSFSSAFVLAAASVALFANWLAHKDRRRLLFWASFNTLLLVSCCLLWFIQARHLYYVGLKEEWTVVWGGFPPDREPLTLLTWSVRAFERVANYAATGLGIPLVLLAVAGAVRCWQRSKDTAILVVGPIVVTYLASLVGKYPMADRAIFFLTPCVWLLAVEGLLYLTARLPSACAPAMALAVLGLMAPGVVHTAKYCARVMPLMAYREALVYEHEHRSEGDAVWNWCEDLHTVYTDHVFRWKENTDRNNPQDALQAGREALLHPLWVIAPDNLAERMIQPLQALPLRQTVCKQFLGLKVLRFEAVN
jgi:hypothetical protein